MSMQLVREANVYMQTKNAKKRLRSVSIRTAGKNTTVQIVWCRGWQDVIDPFIYYTKEVNPTK